MARLKDVAAVARSLATGMAMKRGGSQDFHAPLPSPADLGVDDLAPERTAAVATALDGGAIVAARLLAEGAVTSEELVAGCVGRILERDPALRSVIELAPDAVAQARASDERRRAGALRGPLDGIPVSVKANISVAGMAASAGAEILGGHIAPDAELVTRLRDAGVLLLATANLSELAGAVSRTPGTSALGGRTVNPFGDGFTPGGSSSGSAVSVAAGLVPLSVGTETSGSLIAPATFCGVVAIKPTRGLVSGEGVVPLIRFQDTAGPVAPTVTEAAALLDAMACSATVPDHGDALADARIGVLRAEVEAQKSPFEDVATNPVMLDRLEAGLRAAGAEPTPAAMQDRETVENGLLKLIFGGLAHDTVGYLVAAGAPVASVADLHAYNLADPRRRMPFGQDLLTAALVMQPSLAAYEEGALALREQAVRMLEETFERAGTDILVSMSNTHSAIYATAGCPAVTVPLGLRSSGMPAGATFIGRAGADAALVAAAYAFEQATRLRARPAG